nr:conserved hypothetical protein [Hymenolepis microstoma]
MNSLRETGRRIHQYFSTFYNNFKEDLYREFNWDIEQTNASLNLNKSNVASSEDSYDDEESDEEDSDVVDFQDKDMKCCLFCACFECCFCWNFPGKKYYDKAYYKLQSKIDGCPMACPTLIPRSLDEEWRFNGKYGGRFALCECLASPQYIVCLKYLDVILCPICDVWDILKGIDFGYRRFRIQAYIHRYHEAEMGIKTFCV